ncbi:LPD38 domain-containing protein [Chitiniphilus eburneus]|uniref:Large polyvalent protein associated domain-containing protein n=1 Tax=Chitiniphilus eburneus TaxID=2571148 RepID=A0A4U0PPC9_9NEIS|nr:LPD38 domain-containing protein [Chitiniphilus eburneus]TJZ69760.1 hypothetical protein FAZ21_14675 [Chitiniphilus eburneus]
MAEPWKKYSGTNSGGTPWTKYGPTPAAAPADAPGDVWQGVKSGAANLGKSAARAVEGIATAVGAQGLKESAGRVAESLGETADRNAPRIGRVEDIQSLGDAADWAQGVGTSSAVQMAPSLAGAAAGARMGQRFGGARGAAIGGVLGAVAPSFVQQFGEMYDEQRQAGADDPGQAAAYAAPAAALDALPVGRVVGKVVAPAAKEVVQGVVKRGLKGMVEGGLAEGATEAAQEGLAIANRAGVDPTYDATGDDARSRILNAAAGGVLLGGPLGGVGGIAERGSRTEAPQQASELPAQVEQPAAATDATPAPPGSIKFERVMPPQQELALAEQGSERAPDGIDYERQIDTTGLALEDGAAAQPVAMPAPELDTSHLALNPMNPLTAPAAPRGPLARAAAMAPQQRVLEGEWLGPENAVTPAQPVAGAVEGPVIEGELGQPRAFARPALAAEGMEAQARPGREVAALPAPADQVESLPAATAELPPDPSSPAQQPDLAPPNAGQVVSGPLASAYRNDYGAIRIKGEVGQLRSALAERGIKGGLYDRRNGELVFPPGSRLASDPDAVAKIRGEMPMQPDHLATAYRTDNGGVRIKGPVAEVRAALSARGIQGGLYDRANGELVFPPGSRMANDPQALARIRGAAVEVPAAPAGPAGNPLNLSLAKEGGEYVARDAAGVEVARAPYLVPFGERVRQYEATQGIARGSGIRIVPGQIQERPAGQAKPAQPTKTDPESLPSGTSAQYSRGGQRSTGEPIQVALEAAKNNATEKIEVELAQASASDVAEARQTLGVDLSGYRHTADNYAIRHAIRRHGTDKEYKHGQIPLTDSDFLAAQAAVETPDASVYGAKNERGQDVIGRLKRLDDGTLLYVEEVRTGRKTLAMASMRKYPATKDATAIARSLLHNAQDDSGDAASIVWRAQQDNGNSEGTLVWSGRPREPVQAPAHSSDQDPKPPLHDFQRAGPPASPEAPGSGGESRLNPRPVGRFADQTRTDSVPPTDAEGNAEGQPYRRAEGKIGGIPAATVERMLINRSAGWENAPDIAVVQRIDDLPAHLRQQITRDGATDVEGVYDNGRVYLVADNLRSPKHAAFTLLHEVMGHHGLRGVFGRKLNPLLNSLYHSHAELRAGADALIERYGYDRALAVEEVLADMAARGEIQQQPFWPRLVQAIKNWLRQVGFDMPWTDADIQGVLASARRYVEGRSAPAAEGMPAAASAYSRAGQRAWDLADRFAQRNDTPMPDNLTDSQRAALGKIGTYAGTRPIRETASELTDRWKLKVVQGVFDQFRPLRDLDETAYMQARLSKGTDGAVESVFKFGPPKLTDGALDVTRDGKGLQGILADLGGEHDRFMAWIAGNRAKQLKGEGRERLFSDDDIAALTSLNQGQMADGRSRAGTFAKAIAQFRAYQKAVLDVATEAGLIDGKGRELWESEFYVPFYRVMEEDGTGTAGPGQIGGIVGQRAFQKLKGGKEPLGDLLANTLSNWSHLLSASMKNLAAQRALTAAEKAGIAEQITSAEKGSVRVMRDGHEKHYQVHDPLVLDALTMLHHQGWNNPAMKAMRTMKHLLTTGVTMSPTFRVRNLIRDMVSAIAVNDMGYNPVRNVIDGWKATGEGSDTLARLIAGGGAVRFGALNDGDQATYAKRLIDSGVKADQILDGPAKVKAFFRKGWDWYQEMGDRLETVNRAALYEKARADGKSHLEASYAARDMMDFTSAGKWASVRFLTQIVPFMNARLQGMYKLGRGGWNDPRRFATVAGAVALASVALHLINQDDEEYKQLPDWVRNTYWWVKLGDKAFYIPKPFELGALGTVVERGAELATAGNDYQARDFAQTVLRVVGDQLAMNPTPQLVKPFMEASFNRDPFRDRAIDSPGQMRLPPEERYTARTSAGAVAAGQLLGASPQRIEHLMRGYFGWLGTQALNVSDLVGRPLMDLPGKPARAIGDTFVLGDFVKDSDANGGKYLSRFYEQQKQVDQLYAAFNLARTTGDLERAQELAGDNRLRQRAVFNAVGRQITELNRRIKAVSNDRGMDAEERRSLLDTLNAQRERLARMADERARQSA